LVKGANTFGKTFSISESRENLERSNVKWTGMTAANSYEHTTQVVQEKKSECDF
jgi:hypothetical protein